MLGKQLCGAVGDFDLCHRQLNVMLWYCIVYIQATWDCSPFHFFLRVSWFTNNNQITLQLAH